MYLSHGIATIRNPIFLQGHSMHLGGKKKDPFNVDWIDDGVAFIGKMATSSSCFSGSTMLLSMYFLYFMNRQLTAEEKRLRDLRTPRVALWQFKFSSFNYLYNSRDDQALLNWCGCTHGVFNELLSLFKPYFDAFTFDKRSGAIRMVGTTKKGRRRVLKETWMQEVALA